MVALDLLFRWLHDAIILTATYTMCVCRGFFGRTTLWTLIVQLTKFEALISIAKKSWWVLYGNEACDSLHKRVVDNSPDLGDIKITRVAKHSCHGWP